MVRLPLPVALLSLILFAGMGNVARAGDYCYPKAPPVLSTKITYTEWVTEAKEHTRTVLKTVYRDEPCPDCAAGCGQGHCTQKVAVQVPITEKYTIWCAVPRIVTREIPLAVPRCEHDDCKCK